MCQCLINCSLLKDPRSKNNSKNKKFMLLSERSDVFSKILTKYLFQISINKIHPVNNLRAPSNSLGTPSLSISIAVI